jgi:hypothetical protein
MLDKVNAPAEVLADQGRGDWRINEFRNHRFIERRAKCKNGEAWYENRGRYSWKYGPNCSTCFDTWVRFGVPLPGRQR